MLSLQERRRRDGKWCPHKTILESDESLDYSDSESKEEQVNHGEDTQCKHLVVTETPNSISSLENSEARQKELGEVTDC